MIYFLETLDEIKEWKNIKKLIIPVLSDPKKHWAINRVSFIYVYDLTSFNESVISFNHCDAEPVNICVLSDFIGLGNYIYHKKYLGDCRGNYDAQMAYWIETNQRLEQEPSNIIKSYWNQFKGYENINDCIPIMKWLEWCRDLKDKFVIKVKNYDPDETLKQYDKLLENLSIIEKNGLSVN